MKIDVIVLSEILEELERDLILGFANDKEEKELIRQLLAQTRKKIHINIKD